MDWSLKIDSAFPRPLRVILRGVGQVFFCCNAVTGLIFLIALFIGGVTAGAAATVGVISSTAAAYLLGFSEDDIDAGLYGFNGTLVGPCLFFVSGALPAIVAVCRSCIDTLDCRAGGADAHTSSL